MGSLGTSENVATVYIVRHGESMMNVSRKMLAPSDDVLTPNGQFQAKLLGKLMQEEKFTKAFTSPYARCVETANIILEETGSKVKVEEDARLVERGLGKYEQVGADLKEIIGSFTASGKPFMEWMPEGGESREERQGRIHSFLEDLIRYIDNSESREPEIILVLSHGGHLYEFWAEVKANESRYNVLNWTPPMEKLTQNTGFFKIQIPKKPSLLIPRTIQIIIAQGNEHLKELSGDTIANHAKTGSGDVKRYDGCMHQ